MVNPPTTTSSYALVLGSSGANSSTIINFDGRITLSPPADEAGTKYYNNGPFIYLLPHRSADVRDGLSQTFFVGETYDGQLPDSMNSWPLSIAHLSSMRSTNNPLNSQPGGGGVAQVTNSPQTYTLLLSTPMLVQANGSSFTIQLQTQTIDSHSGLSGLPTTATGAFGSRHPGGGNFAFGDGHVKYIPNLIDFPIYQALSTIARGEPISGEF